VRPGIKVKDLSIGDGAVAERGCIVTIRYDGFLNRGAQFQAGEIATFLLGGRSVIPGLEYGVEGMRVGSHRRIRVSPHLAYQSTGVPGIVPGNAVLVFEIELLSVAFPPNTP